MCSIIQFYIPKISYLTSSIHFFYELMSETNQNNIHEYILQDYMLMIELTLDHYYYIDIG